MTASNFQVPELRLEYRQVLMCPKCKVGTFQPSADVNIFYICDNCGHTLWNVSSNNKKALPKKGLSGLESD